MTRDLDRSNFSIASSTGSNHGTITRSLSPTAFDQTASSFSPDNSEIFASTPAARPPQLRETAEKYGRWSPRRGQTPTINLSMMDNAFKGFSGVLASNNETFTLDLPRANLPSRFQPSPTPASGDNNSYLSASLKVPMPAEQEQDKENAPQAKPHGSHKSLKGSSTKGSPYISYASRTINGERRTLAELHAQVVDGSENSIMFNERTSTITLPYKSTRWSKAQLTSNPTSSVPVPQGQASLKPHDPQPSREHKRSMSVAQALPQVSHPPNTSGTSLPSRQHFTTTVSVVEPSLERKRSISVMIPTITTTVASENCQALKTSIPEGLSQPPSRRHSEPESISLGSPQPASHSQPPITEYRTRGMRSNSDPTFLTQTFVIPAECSEKTKPIDNRLPVLVRDGKVEAPPQTRRRHVINGIPIPEDEDELYKMIVDLHSSIRSLVDINKSQATEADVLQAQIDLLKSDNGSLKTENGSLKEEIISLKTDIAAFHSTPAEISIPRSRNGYYRDQNLMQDDLTCDSVPTKTSFRSRASVKSTRSVTTTSIQLGQTEDAVQDDLTNVTKASAHSARIQAHSTRKPLNFHGPSENLTSGYIVQDIQAAERDHPVLSSNARKVLDGLCEHNCRDCTICMRVHAFHNRPAPKRPKKTVRVERPVPRSMQNLHDDTLRPADTPGLALAVVIRDLEEEIAHLKQRHSEAAALYYQHDATKKRAIRMQIGKEMDIQKGMIDRKSDQLYRLYDALEGQVMAGQTMEQSVVDITVISEREMDDTLPWEHILDED
jgi:hypothetical protein